MSDHHHHDHQHHVHNHDPKEHLEYAKAYCEARGVRFTPLREEVFSLILEANKPLGAYDLITALQNSRQATDAKNKNVAPPTVYRSLEFLLGEGLIHQLSSINAYVPCCHPRSAHTAAFLICKKCHSVEECSNIPVNAMIDFAKNDAGFEIEHTVIELRGVCRDCR